MHTYKVRLTSQAKSERIEIERYINRRFGRKAVLDFRSLVKESIVKLANSPTWGKMVVTEEGVVLYDWLVHTNLRIFYRQDANVVHIVSFWDNRRNPSHRPGG